jgi:hypothetical protein
MLWNIFMFETALLQEYMVWILTVVIIYDIWIRYIHQTQRLPGLSFHSLTCTLKSQVQIWPISCLFLWIFHQCQLLFYHHNPLSLSVLPWAGTSLQTNTHCVGGIETSSLDWATMIIFKKFWLRESYVLTDIVVSMKQQK